MLNESKAHLNAFTHTLLPNDKDKALTFVHILWAYAVESASQESGDIIALFLNDSTKQISEKS